MPKLLCALEFVWKFSRFKDVFFLLEYLDGNKMRKTPNKKEKLIKKKKKNLDKEENRHWKSEKKEIKYQC